MTWFTFTIWLAVIYVLYYGGLITWELLRSKRQGSGDDQNELAFVEESAPLRAVWEDERPPVSAGVTSVVASGGVRLKEIFKLAQEDAIEFIRPVSF